VLVAELELFLSRPVAPTRRVALGVADLPTDPAPGWGGILLGAVVASRVADVDLDLLPDLFHLTRQLEAGERIPQPRLRHRLQQDRIGLTSHRHRLLLSDGDVRFDLDDRGRAGPHVLGALYAAGRLAVRDRPAVFGLLRRALVWQGEVGPALLAHLTGERASGWSMDGDVRTRAWAITVLGLADDRPEPAVVQRRFRELVRAAHPDHGGRVDEAASRIDALSRARRILLDERA